MTNVSTAGYKTDRYTDSTAFREVMLSRVGNKDKVNTEEIGIDASVLIHIDVVRGQLNGLAVFIQHPSLPRQDQIALPYAYILAPDQLYTDYTQGSLEETELPLDFAIEGDGFFAMLRSSAPLSWKAKIPRVAR